MLLKFNDDACWLVDGLRDDRDEENGNGAADRSGNCLDPLCEARGLIVRDPLEAMATHSNIRMPSVILALNAESRF